MFRIQARIFLLPQGFACQPFLQLLLHCILLDDTSFYGILVRRMLIILKEREIVKERFDIEQVHKYAADGRELQTRCTLENVLTKRFDDIIIPIFAEVLAVIDQFFNLYLLDDRSVPEEDRRDIKTLWFQIFSNKTVLQLTWARMAPRVDTGVDIRAAETRVKLAHGFQCQFPFFWVFMEIIDSLLDKAKTEAGQ